MKSNVSKWCWKHEKSVSPGRVDVKSHYIKAIAIRCPRKNPPNPYSALIFTQFRQMNSDLIPHFWNNMINHPSDIEEIVQIGYEMTELQAFNIYQPSITYFEPSVDLHIPGRPCIGFLYYWHMWKHVWKAIYTNYVEQY